MSSECPALQGNSPLPACQLSGAGFGGSTNSSSLQFLTKVHLNGPQKEPGIQPPPWSLCLLTHSVSGTAPYRQEPVGQDSWPAFLLCSFKGLLKGRQPQRPLLPKAAYPWEGSTANKRLQSYRAKLLLSVLPIRLNLEERKSSPNPPAPTTINKSQEKPFRTLQQMPLQTPSSINAFPRTLRTGLASPIANWLEKQGSIFAV